MKITKCEKVTLTQVTKKTRQYPNTSRRFGKGRQALQLGLPYLTHMLARP